MDTKVVNNQVNLKSSTGNGAHDIIEKTKETMRKSGLPYEEIQKVQEKYPDLDIGVVEYPVLGTITESAKVAIALSKRIDKPVVFGFQDEAWVVTKDDTPEKVQETFDKILEERRKAYWTPEREAEAKRKKEIETTARKAYAEVIYKGLPEEFKKYADEEELVYDRATHIFIAKDAYILVTALKTEEEVRKWNDQPYDIPGLETDHSDGTMYGVVCTAIGHIREKVGKSPYTSVPKRFIVDTYTDK